MTALDQAPDAYGELRRALAFVDRMLTNSKRAAVRGGAAHLVVEFDEAALGLARASSLLSERDGLIEALAWFDAVRAKCPVNKPRLDRPAVCPRCDATRRDPCGLVASATEALVGSLRQALSGEAK